MGWLFYGSFKKRRQNSNATYNFPKEIYKCSQKWYTDQENDTEFLQDHFNPTLSQIFSMISPRSNFTMCLQVYCDYHGHSRRKNIFLYGCSPTMSWIPNDSVNPATTGNRMEDNAYKVVLIL